MQQATNTPLKGTKTNNHAQNFLINTKKHAILELALSDAKWNEQTQLSYIQKIKSIIFLNVTIAFQCIKWFPKQRCKQKEKKWKET